MLGQLGFAAPAAEDAFSELVSKYGGKEHTSASKPDEMPEVPKSKKAEMKLASEVKLGTWGEAIEPLRPRKTVVSKNALGTSKDSTRLKRVSTLKPEKSKYTLQVGAYTSVEEAKRVLVTLNSKKIGGLLFRMKSSEQYPYKVFVGQFKTNREAKEFASFNLEPEGIAYFVAPLSSSDMIALEMAQESSRAPASSPESRPMGQAQQRAEEEKGEQEGMLLDEWGGAKPYFSKHGIEIEADYKLDLIRNFSGGLNQKGTVIGNFDVKTGFDFEKMGLVKGLKLHLYGLANHGDPATEFVGDSFATSNIEAPDGVRLFEAYLEQNVDEHFQIAVGLRDLNAIYNSSATAGDFLNAAFGISPSISQTGANGPSIFPVTSLAANVRYEATNSFYFQAGVFNALSGDPSHVHSTEINASNRDGSLMIYEVGFAKPEGNDSFKFGAGSWVYTKDQDRIDGSGTHQNAGYYFIVDKRFSGLFATFLKHGMAQPKLNTFESSTEVGLTLTGMLPKRGSDVFGIGYAYSKASEDYKTLNSSTSGEAAIDVLYKIKVAPGLSLTPDFQYVIHPGLDPNVKDAQVGALRVQLDF